MRGKLSISAVLVFVARITPADAGKTVLKLINYHIQKDHPRGCGENVRCRAGSRHPQGSPPRMRGKPVKARKFKRGTRITPAGAGKTLPSRFNSFLIRDHPRRCGENISRNNRQRSDLGSPPQVRGKPDYSAVYLHISRITPAGAGKTGRSRPLPLA